MIFRINPARWTLNARPDRSEVTNSLWYFPNPSFFGKYFKAATGLTPRKYRMQQHC